ncbi:MAG: FAD-linked oxidase C-terminal domain-containing protein, partial [Chloroflexota bacterium]
ALAKLTCLPTQIATLAEMIDQAATEAGASAADLQLMAHAGNGVLYVALPAVTVDLLHRLWGATTELGGSMVVEHAPAAIQQAIDVWGPTRNDFPLMQALKAQFDPQGTLNPGRFVGGI